MNTSKLIQKASKEVRLEYKKIFGTTDGKIIRELNKCAKIKEPQHPYFREPKASNYKEALPEDLKLLMSSAPKDLLKKCTYVDPKSLKIYNVLLKEKNNDNTLTIRILDTFGKFIKEAKISPQKVIVLDNFTSPTTAMIYDGTEKIPHGEIVKKLIEKSNPFNNYEFIDASNGENSIDCFNKLRHILNRAKNGEKIDAICGSYARETTIDDIGNLLGQKLIDKPMIFQKKIVQETFKKLKKLTSKEREEYFRCFVKDFKEEDVQVINDYFKVNKELKLYDELHKRGIKIFLGAGNDTKIINGKRVETINYNLFSDGVQGVGALDNYNKIASYSSSRKSIFTPNYEKGEIYIDFREGGFNFAGGVGFDVPYSKRAEDLYKKIKSLDTSEFEKQGIKLTFLYNIPVRINYNTHSAMPAAIIKNGTSWATPRRVGEYTKYLMLKDII